MEQCVCADRIALADQLDAAPAHHLFEVFDGLEMSVDERLIDELPKVLSGLQLRTMWRLEHEPDAVWNGKVFRAMPARTIKLKDDAFVPARARRFCEIGKDGLEHLLANRVLDIPYCGSGGRFHKSPDIEPFVAVMAKRNRAQALWCPYPFNDGLQADPVLVHRPDLDGGFRMVAFLFSGGVLQFFLIQRDPLRLRLWDGEVWGFGWNSRWPPARPSRADCAWTCGRGTP